MSWIQQVLFGVDLDETQATLDRTNAAIAAENERDRAQYGDKWFNEAQAHLNVNIEEERDVAGAVDQSFDEGLQEGADNVTNIVSKIFKIPATAASSVLKGFPWWLWLAGLAVVALYAWPFLGPLLTKRRVIR